jgi:hypothetical protein
MKIRIAAPALVLALCSATRGAAQDPFAGRTLDPATLRPATRSTVAGGSTTVSLRPGMRPTVEVFVDGRGPFAFNVETAGGVTELSAAAAGRLGLRVRSEGTNLPVVDLDSLRVGGASLAGITAVAADRLPPDVDGILGLATLARLLVTVDPAAGTLTLATGSLPAPNGRDLLPLVPAGPYWGIGRMWGVEIEAGGRRVPAVLNLQSPGGFGTVPEMADDAGFAAPPAVVGQVRGPIFGTVDRRVGRMAGDVRIGAYTFQRPLVSVLPLPPQLPQGWSVGAGVLRGFALTIDQRNRVVRLARADTAPVPAPPSIRDFGFDVGGPGDDAAAVARVAPGSPAERAGIQPGDVLVAADGRAAAALDGAAWRGLLARTGPVAFRFRRGAAERDVSLAAVTLVQ